MNGTHLMAIGMVFALGSFAGCSDDDGGTGPGGGTGLRDWPVVELPAELVDGMVLSLDAAGDRTVGLAVGSSGSWVIERGAAGWETIGAKPLPGTLGRPPILIPMFASGLAIDGRGKVQVVGADVVEPSPAVWSEGDTGWDVTAPAGSQVRGALQAVVALRAQDIVASGFGTSAVLVATGSIYDGLDFGLVTTPGDLGEKSLVDLTESLDVVYGLGFDDGADGSPGQPFRIVMQYREGAWSMMPSPCGDCAFREFWAIAASPSGLYVGGAITDFSQEAVDESVAWLMMWSFVAEEWTEVELPSAGELDRVVDILVSSSGDVFLACGDQAAAIVKMPVSGNGVVEWEDDGIVLFGLGESGDGTLLACGLIEGVENGTPVVLERE